MFILYLYISAFTREGKKSSTFSEGKEGEGGDEDGLWAQWDIFMILVMLAMNRYVMCM